MPLSNPALVIPQHPIYQTKACRLVRELKFSNHTPTNDAMLIVYSFADSENLRGGEFQCMRKELARQYKCTERHCSRLFNRLIDDGLLRIVRNEFNRATRTTLRTFVLTDKSAKIVENSLMILGGDIHAAEGYRRSGESTGHSANTTDLRFRPAGHLDREDENRPLYLVPGLSEKQKSIDYEMMSRGKGGTPPSESRSKRKRSKSKKKSSDQPWKVVRAIFGTQGYDYRELNDMMSQCVDRMGGSCKRAREFFQRTLVDSPDCVSLASGKRMFIRFCQQNGIYSRV